MKINFIKKLLNIFKKNGKIEENILNTNDNLFDGNKYSTLSNNDLSHYKTASINNDVRTLNELEEVNCKEVAITEIYNYVQKKLKENSMKFLNCCVTENEWKLFFDKVYDQFVNYKLQNGYSSLMKTNIDYIFYKQYLYGVSEITFQDIIEQFDISILPLNVAKNMLNNIKKSVYLAIRENYVMESQKHYQISRK